MLNNGVEPANSASAGFAQYDPSTEGDGEEEMKMNRRTEIVLIPNLEDVLGTTDTAVVVEKTPES